MFLVHLKDAEPIRFPEGSNWEIDEFGRLRVDINGIDVAVFADGGWVAVTRPVPEPEAPIDDDSDEDAD